MSLFGTYIQEATSNDILEVRKSVILESYQEVCNPKEINFFGTKTTIKVKSDDPKSKLISKVDSVLKTICNASLYNYLYNLDKDFYEKEINEDPYFNGKKIKSGEDLKNALKEQITHKNTNIFISNYHNAIYFCGEYFIDDEHGYSIVFPKGNLIKGKPGDSKLDKQYKPLITYIGQYSDPL